MSQPTATTYDIVIFGASALAGRNPSKLTQALNWAHPSYPNNIPIITADISDPLSLTQMASQAKVVLNCVGPFRLYGEKVVKACVESGCDYLDISGEPEFMERMEAVYNDKAAADGSLVVSACGFDSVPAELGFMFNVRQWGEMGVPNRVEAYLSLESEKRIVGNFGTFESAVLGVANMDKLAELRRSRPRRYFEIPGPGPGPAKGSTIEHQKKIGLWAVKLPSADAIVVRRTLAALTENPSGLQGVNEDPKQAENELPFWSTHKTCAILEVKIATKSYFGCHCFGGFKKEGPTEEQVESARFKMWFVGQGFSDANVASQRNAKPDTEVITRVMGPEIGYLTTPIILVQCALILLKQRQDLPKGGVYPPGIVFGPTDLQDRLQENGISFDLISKNRISM
ncbi:probable mitochondrial saccharopine dehydrogenase-like oxidoreductase [Tanacetum coccineum]